MDQDYTLAKLIEKYQIFHCVECGKCTGACPLAQVDRDFSPRLVAKYAIEEGLGSDYVKEKVWTCLTCGLCNDRCPIGISFTEFIRSVRSLFITEEFNGHLSHGGALQGLMRMQTAPDLSQNRLDWVNDEHRISSHGEILYFIGCLTYFETFFSTMNLKLKQIAADTVKILNSVSVTPVVLPDERCCGHDLIWTGDEKSFHKLRRLNIESFKKAGVKTIITSCAECCYTLKNLYPQSAEPFPFEVMHISEYLQKIGFSAKKELNKIATYQDPCRLGRFMEIYDAPRQLLESVMELREMPHFRAGSWCCGNSAWLHCDRYSKQLQVERLMEAKGTKSDLIVTACPKCQVHLTCAMNDVNLIQDLSMKIRDISSILAESIE
ncbi:MAG: (Fe-S)-binding protein [Thermodesulfobacteriota bacterium]|nr:(Fe-S)-binding protein [Thermodesulfobacteriota bacterium]